METAPLKADALVSDAVHAHALGRMMGAVSMIHMSAANTMWEAASDACKRVDPDRQLRLWEAFTYGWNLAVQSLTHGIAMPDIDTASQTLTRPGDGAAPGDNCPTDGCTGIARWIPTQPQHIRDQGRYYCTNCCDAFAGR